MKEPDFAKEPLIINLALTGAVADANKNSNVPITHEHIVETAKECVTAGASIGHFHVRDAQGHPVCDAEAFGRIFAELREDEVAKDLILCATTSGRHGQTVAQRCEVLNLPADIRPQMASLTLSSVNFVTGASVNCPDTIRSIAEDMKKNNVKPELEVFDIGMAEFAHVLIAEGLLEPPYYFNILLGNIAGLKTNASHVAAVINSLPEGSIYAFAGIGRYQLHANVLGITHAHGVRTGLEDNLWMDANKTPATNRELVSRIAKISELSQRRVASPGETRAILELD